MQITVGLLSVELGCRSTHTFPQHALRDKLDAQAHCQHPLTLAKYALLKYWSSKNLAASMTDVTITLRIETIIHKVIGNNTQSMTTGVRSLVFVKQLRLEMKPKVSACFHG